MKRVVFAGAGLIAMAVLVAAALASWLLLTEGGLNFAFSRLLPALPVTVTAEQLSGRIAGRITLTGLRVSDGSFQANVGRTEAELSLSRLFAGEVNLVMLALSDIQIDPGSGQSPGSGEEPLKPAVPEPKLPFRLRIDQFTASGISLLRPGQVPLSMRSLGVAGLSFSGDQWRVERFEVDSDLLSGGGDLAYLASGKHDIRINFNGVTQLTDNKITLAISIEGNEDKVSITQDLGGAISGRVSGVVEDLLSAPRWTTKVALEFARLGLLNPDWPDSRLRVDLEAQGQKDEAQGTGSLALDGQPQLEYVVALQDIFGGVVVKRLELRERDGPASVAFAGRLIPSAPFPDIEGQLSWAALSWPLAQTDGEAAMLSSPSGAFDVRGAAGNYELKGQAAIGNGETEGTLSAAGVLDLRNEQPRFDLQGAWDAFTVRTSLRTYVARDGHYSLAGLLSDYRFSSDFNLLGEDWPALKFVASGQGNQQMLNFESLEVSSAAGILEGRGSLGLAQEFPFQLSVRGKGIDPGAFASGWPGQLAFDATLKGLLAADEVDVSLSLRNLRGQLRGQALAASAELGYARETLKLTRLTANWADAELSAEGSLGTGMDFSWRVSVPDLARLSEAGAGRLSSSGKLTGPSSSPLLVAELDGEGLTFGEYAAKQLNADVNIDFADPESSSVTALAVGVVVPGSVISKIEMQGGGEAGKHRASLRVETDKGVMATEISGAMDKGHWLGTLDSTRIAFEKSEWLQDAPSPLRVSQSDWSLGNTCLRSAPALVCLSANRAEGETPSIELLLESLPLAELGLLLPEGLFYAGNVSGRAQVRGLGEASVGSASFEVAGGKVWQVVDDEELVLMDFRSMNGEAQLADGRLQLSALLREPGNPEVALEASLPYEDWQLVQGPVSGRLDGTLESLGFLSVLFPDLADLKGRLETQVRLSGSLEAPVWDGHAELLEAQAIIPGLGITLSGMTARVDASGNQLRLAGHVMSGQGVLDLIGELSLSDSGARGRMRLTGLNFLAADLPEVRVLVSPDLSLDIEGRSLRLEGDVRVPEAHIAPRDLSEAIQRSPDEQIVGVDGTPAQATGWVLSSRVRIEFGDKVTFDSFGLEARITGAVTAVDEPGRVTTATGEVQIVDGTYVAYGRALEVRRGRLLFTGGPLANPGLDILALRKIQGGPEAGVIARATLGQPELTLYADPSMASAQTLSYLLVGRPLSEIEGADRTLVNDTATQLATAGGGLFAQQLGRRFGLEDVSVGGGASGGAASLVIGKYLSPRLYASYGIGLFEPVNTLRLRYTLSSKWNLRAESGLNQSADLEYSLER